MAMAGTLQSLVKQNSQQLVKGANGVLQQQDNSSPQDIQSLSGQAGLSAPPTDPVSAGVLGAGPHTQKMMGSPAQVQSAQKIATDPSLDLSTAVREAQSRSQSSQQEQQAQKKSKDMQDMGALGDRVQGLIDKKASDLAQAAPITAGAVQTVAPTATGIGSALPTDPAALATIKTAAQALLTNPNDMNSLLALNKALGRDVNSQVDATQLQSLYESSSDTLSRTGAAAMTAGGTVQVGQLIAQGNFGYDLPTLSNLLNVPAAQLSTMSVTQLQAAIAKEQQAEFSKSSTLQQQQQSNVLGSAEKAQAGQLGRESSATGQRASEDDYNRMDQQVRGADQVSFGGQRYQVDDLLSNSTVSGIISDYLANPNSDTSKQLAQTEPGLVQFVQKNQSVLQDAVAAMGAGVKQFAGIQTSNAGVAKVGQTTISDDLMDSLYPDQAGQLSASKIDTSSKPFFQQLKSLPANAQEDYAKEANILVAGDPDAAKQLAGLNQAQLANLQLDKGNTSPAMQIYQGNRQFSDQLRMTSPDNAQAVLAAASGDPSLTPDKIQNDLDTNKTAKALGLSGVSDNSFYTDASGKPLDSSTLLQKLQKAVPQATLTDVANGKGTVYQPNVPSAYNPPDGLSSRIMQVLGQAAADGSITADEVQSAGLTQADLHGIDSSGIAGKWSGDGASAVSSMLDAAKQSNTAAALGTVPDAPDAPPPGVPDYSPDTVAKFQAADQALQMQIPTLTALINQWKDNPNQAGKEAGVDMDTLAARLQAATTADAAYQADVQAMQLAKANADSAAAKAAADKAAAASANAKAAQKDPANQLANTAKSGLEVAKGLTSGNGADVAVGKGLKAGTQVLQDIISAPSLKKLKFR